MTVNRTLRAAAAFALALTGATGASAQSPADNQEAGLAFAECMRENGFTEFPDPSSNGRMQLRVTPESAPRFQTAQQACRDLAPAGLADDGISAETMEGLLRLAQCIRDNGVPNFPDPGPEGGFELSPANVDPENPRLQAAMDGCTEELGPVQGGMRITVTR